jgi:hypothetical protein
MCKTYAKGFRPLGKAPDSPFTPPSQGLVSAAARDAEPLEAEHSLPVVRIEHNSRDLGGPVRIVTGPSAKRVQ